MQVQQCGTYTTVFLEEKWPATKKAMEFSTNFLKLNCGVASSALLSSNNIALILAYIAHRWDYSIQPEEADQLRRYLLLSNTINSRVPKNGVSRSKRLLKHPPVPHQHWAWELRTSLTKAGMVRNVVRNLPTHFSSFLWRLLSLWQVGDIRKITWPACRHLVGSKIVNGNKWHVNVANFH